MFEENFYRRVLEWKNLWNKEIVSNLFWQKHKISFSDARKILLKCCGDECLSTRQASKWYKSFGDGHEAGGPLTSTIDAKIK